MVQALSSILDITDDDIRISGLCSEMSTSRTSEACSHLTKIITLVMVMLHGQVNYI